MVNEVDKKVEKRCKGTFPSPENQFKKGIYPGGPGHPKGMPNYKTRFKKLLEKYAGMKIPKVVRGTTHNLQAIDFHLQNPKDLTFEEAIGAKVVIDAIEGKPHALERMYDKPAQPMEVKSEITYPQGIEVKFIKAEQKDK